MNMCNECKTPFTCSVGGHCFINGIPYGYIPPVRKETTVQVVNSVRGEVLEFAQQMEQKLRKRDGYGGWAHLPLAYVLEKLENEMRELRTALQYESPEEVMNEAVDVANFAMFIWDIMRSQKDTREGLVRRGGKEEAQK